MRVFVTQLGVVLALVLFLPDASAQCCRRIVSKPVFQNPNRSSGSTITIARGTRQETKSNSSAGWEVAGAKPVRYDGLDLKIISGTPQRRLATVNNQTFLAGETLRVTVKRDTIRVRCLEIRDRSVLIEVYGEGAPRELKLQAWQ
jgi:hypothetical protein